MNKGMINYFRKISMILSLFHQLNFKAPSNHWFCIKTITDFPLFWKQLKRFIMNIPDVINRRRFCQRPLGRSAAFQNRNAAYKKKLVNTLPVCGFDKVFCCIDRVFLMVCFAAGCLGSAMNYQFYIMHKLWRVVTTKITAGILGPWNSFCIGWKRSWQ